MSQYQNCWLNDTPIRHIHKNLIDPHHLTVFVDVDEMDPTGSYFIDLRADSGTPLFHFEDLRLDVGINTVLFKELVREDETTQIDVVLSRTPHKNLFFFSTLGACPRIATHALRANFDRVP
ncbi:MAG: hypothetical protein U9R69_11200 [Thermodesulfobacteriota bacterium]|nr:hypothetical protein [Thermodesulfobacteriota bacterium]